VGGGARRKSAKRRNAAPPLRTRLHRRDLRALVLAAGADQAAVGGAHLPGRARQGAARRRRHAAAAQAATGATQACGAQKG